MIGSRYVTPLSLYLFGPITSPSQLGRNYVEETATYNYTDGAASIGLAKAAAADSNPATTSATAEEMLHFWYNKADDKTKARFKAFVNAQ